MTVLGERGVSIETPSFTRRCSSHRQWLWQRQCFAMYNVMKVNVVESANSCAYFAQNRNARCKFNRFHQLGRSGLLWPVEVDNQPYEHTEIAKSLNRSWRGGGRGTASGMVDLKSVLFADRNGARYIKVRPLLTFRRGVIVAVGVVDGCSTGDRC